MISKEYTKDLTEHNTFGMKVSCRSFIEYDSVADLLELDFEDMLRPVKHIGAGSNILFTGDFEGTILHSAIRFIEELSDDGLVSVGSGVSFDEFCDWAASNGYWGPENLSGIPGEVGAAAVQNIGAYGVEVKDIIKTVYCYDVEEEEFVHFGVSECDYEYRDSMFKKSSGRYIITHVLFKLTRESNPRLDYAGVRSAIPEDVALTPVLVRNVILGIRSTKLPDPVLIGSAGSFFKNPIVEQSVYDGIASKSPVAVPFYQVGQMVKIPAAWLIEQCGWKGRRSGNAAVYDKQPLVIINATGRALPEEITALEQKIVSSVRQRFGITLSPEVEHL